MSSAKRFGRRPQLFGPTVFLLLLASVLSAPGGLAAQTGEEGTSSFPLPFLGDKAREAGYDLPLPLGLGLNFIFIDRPTEITRVQAGINDGGLQDVEYLAFDALAHVRTVMARADAWIFPFLSVYLLGGYI